MLQIIALAVAGLIGTMVRQIPAFALRDPAAYADQLADLHRRYDAVSIGGARIGPAMVDVFERLGFFRVFNAPWFTLMLTVLVVSIVACTLDRTPRLWRGVRVVRVMQPPAFFDSRLPERAELHAGPDAAEDVRHVLRRRRYKVRDASPVESGTDGAHHVYGDRNQYFKMATLLTHLGLILFLAGGAVTGALGFETVVFVGEGQTAPVQPVGTPHNLLVKNIRFEAPTRPDGSFADFRTDLAVFRDGREIARKTIRVNEPLHVADFVFHQNTFGPAADLEIRDPDGRLVWTGPMILAGRLLELDVPQGFMTIPGSELGLLALLTRDATGTGALVLQGLAPAGGGRTDDTAFLASLRVGATTDPDTTAGYTITWKGSGAWTGMVVKRDPGQGLIWVAFLSLISGLILSFYFPRRRVWVRVEGERMRLALIAERYVDAGKEFRQLLDDLEARAARRVEGQAAVTMGIADSR